MLQLERNPLRFHTLAPVKIRSDPLRGLIRFPPAEAAVIFLSPGFRRGPVALRSPRTQSGAVPVGGGRRKKIIITPHVRRGFLDVRYKRMVERSREEQRSGRSPKYDSVEKKCHPNMEELSHCCI